MIRWASLIFLKLRLWLKVEGKEHIPAKGAFIFAANHSSYLDPLILASSTSRPLHFIVRIKLLSYPVVGWILKHSNTIPVKSHGRDLSVIKDSLRSLAKGKALGIFPEGTRTKDKKLKQAKSGVGMLVYKAKVPVVPAYIEGAFDALPRRVRTFKRHPVHVCIGKPIDFSKEYAGEQTKETYQRISDEIMRQIAQLKSLHAPLPAGTKPDEFTFPKDFLWGAGTSSHQVEGNNTNNDWWQWEQTRLPQSRSGQACDGWNRFEDDSKLIQTLGHTAHRFSLEWSRIEPQEDQWDGSAINHYAQVIHSLRLKGIEPIVTLHHFTLPLWLARQGGWALQKTPDLFARYVRKTVEALGSGVHHWMTLNEPAVYTYKGYMSSEWPPGMRSPREAVKVFGNLLRGHVLAYVKIKEAYAQKGWKEPMVGISQQVLVFAPFSESSLWDRLSASLRDRMINHLFVRILIRGRGKALGIFNIKLSKARALDFIGLNYYTRDHVRNRGFSLRDVLRGENVLENTRGRKNSLGWEIYPKGLYTLIKAFSKYKLPILISENGICTDNDSERSEFIAEHIDAVARAMKEGAPVIGYLYWSLLDNYEWADGFAPRFGLIEMDYATQGRSIRPSARKFEEIIRSGRVR